MIKVKIQGGKYEKSHIADSKEVQYFEKYQIMQVGKTVRLF